MTPLLALSQRVEVIPDRNERRDALDQRWMAFLAACGFQGVALPNDAAAATALLDRLGPQGIILTGGNDLSDLGGDAPERDATEAAMLAWAETRGVPVLGICRGLQMIAHTYGAKLARLEGHIAARHTVAGPAGMRDVNSFHGWGFHEPPPGFTAAARAHDGSIEALAHQARPLRGVMWHPEREAAFDPKDIHMMRELFGAG